MTRHYEAVVVGGRVSAVVTAALLAKRGIRGLLIDEGELASEDAYNLVDSVPADGGSAVMQLVHRELGLLEELRNRSGPVEPIVQVVWPDERLDLADDPRLRLDELRRVLGRNARGLDGFFERLQAADEEVGAFLDSAKELPASGYFNRRSARSHAKRFEGIGQTVGESDLFSDADPLLVEMFSAPLPFLTHIEDRTLETATLARFARPLARFLAGLRSLRGDRSHRGLFVSLAQRRAFEIQTGALEMADPQGRQVQLRVAGQTETITADAMIDATAELSGLSALPHQKRRKDLSETLQTARPRASHYVLGIELDDAAIPPGMGRHVLLLNGRKDPTRAEPDAADRPIWLTRRPGQRPGRTQLVVAHPITTARAQSQGLDALEIMMKARVERVVPFLQDGHPEIRPLSGRGAARSTRPVLSHPLYEPDLDPDTGITGLPCRTSFKNIFIAGPTVLPGLGVEGEYFSALQAADACEALLRGTKPKRGLAQR